MTYFNRRKSIIKVWDESKHPREPAGSDKGGEFASSGGAGKQGELFPASEGAKESFTEYTTRVFGKPKAGTPGSALPGMTIGDVLAHKATADRPSEWDERGKDLKEEDYGLMGLDKEGPVYRAGTKTASGHRPLSMIAREIRRDWGPKVYFGAKPYLDALSSLSDIKDDYGLDPAKQIVAYFLGNATGWRGPKAREIKAELKKLLK